MSPVRLRLLVLLPLLVVALGGCHARRGGYDTRYLFEPRPADLVVESGVTGQPVRTLATIIGVRRADRDRGAPPVVEARFRVENDTDSPVHVRLDSFTLSSADVATFPPARVFPEEASPDVGPHGQAVYTAMFPLLGDYDLSGLNLRWSLDVDPQDTQ